VRLPLPQPDWQRPPAVTTPNRLRGHWFPVRQPIAHFHHQPLDSLFAHTGQLDQGRRIAGIGSAAQQSGDPKACVSCDSEHAITVLLTWAAIRMGLVPVNKLRCSKEMKNRECVYLRMTQSDFERSA
jgi:hypothetical protein